MKKIIISVLCLVLCLSLASCSRWSMKLGESAETTEPAGTREGFEGVTAPPVEDITDAVTEENAEDKNRTAAIDAVKAYLGDVNPETGLKFVFSYDGTEYKFGEEYIKIRVSEKTEDGLNALYGYYLADKNGNVTEYED